MPSGKGHGHKGHRVKSSDSHNDNDQDKRKKGQGQKSQQSNFRKAYRGNNVQESKDPDEDRRKHDEKLLKELSECLVEYSRQRLRALHMSFRQYGNDESRMTNKEMMQSFQENSVTIPNRILKSLTTKFDSNKGIDLEGMYKFLVEAHGKTRRDSIVAMHKRNDLRRVDVSQEELDEDLLWRIESQLIKSHSYIDIPLLRAEFQKRDLSKCGKIDGNLMKQICTDNQAPVFGALLKNLIKRCDDEKNEKISWPEFISFLEKAQGNAWVNCPSLKDIPEKMKNQTPVAPSPLDELSSRTRTTLVNKLRKKSLARRPSTPEKGHETHTDENQNRQLLNGVIANDTLREDGHNSIKPRVAINTKSDDLEAAKQEHDVNKADEAEHRATTEPQQSKTVNKSVNFTVTESARADGDDKIGIDDTNVDSNASDTGTRKKPDSDEQVKMVVNEDNEYVCTLPPTIPTIPIDIRIEEPSQENTPTRQSLASLPLATDDTNTVDATPADVESAANTDDTQSDKDVSAVDKVSDKVTDNNDVDNDDVDNENKEIVEKTEELKEPTVERVTIKDGRVVSIKTDDEVQQEKQQETTAQKEVTLTVNVKGKDINFTADERYLEQQIIEPPIERMKLLWVYGYRGNDCRKNIHVLGGGEIVYFMSYVAIVYNRTLHKQKHYKEHTDDIKCIDVHSNRIFVATGQFASRKNKDIQAHIRIWRSDTLHTLQVIGMGQFEKSVACVTFSTKKDLLAAVDNSLEKKLTVWDTVTGQCQGQELLNTELVCDIAFNPRQPDILVTIGKGHLCWWKVYPESSTIQTAANPEFEGFLRAKFVICVTFTDKGDLVTGDSNGTIYVFGDNGNKITNYIKHAHDGPVFNVLCYRGHIISGGRDGIIHCWQWGKNMDSTGFVQVPKTEGGIRMLRVHDDKLLCGTTMNSMLVVTLSDTEFPLQDADIETTALTQCHYDDLRGLTSVRSSGIDVITAGLDGVICGFNARERKPVFKFQMKGNQYVCVDADVTGSLLVLGTRDGHVQILEFLEGEWTEQVNRKLCKDRIDYIKLSPDRMSIAAGSHDTCIYIYSYLQKEDLTFVWEFVGKLKGHTGPINGLDWSAEPCDEVYILQTSSSAMELLYWLPATLERFYKTAIIKETRWYSNSMHCHVSVAGILATKCTGEREVVSLGINPAESLVAMGDNSGSLNLFRYPCSLNGAFCHAYKSHAVVHAVRFTPCGSYVMSVGGRDSCLMQWELV